jgi:hypothetical protein
MLRNVSTYDAIPNQILGCVLGESRKRRYAWGHCHDSLYTVVSVLCLVKMYRHHRAVNRGCHHKYLGRHIRHVSLTAAHHDCSVSRCLV